VKKIPNLPFEARPTITHRKPGEHEILHQGPR
jgi:hypothetical protein